MPKVDVLTLPLSARIASLQALLTLLAPIPAEWNLAVKHEDSDGHAPHKPELGPKPCNDYKALLLAWRKALKWRSTMDDVLSVMLATCLSTEQVGDQLFLQVIGDAGSGKTRFCDGLLVSKNCYPLEHLTGFHSGWKGDNGEDYSLISRINRKTLVTPEGDVLVSSPRYGEIMSQQRRIFDGTSGASFKNMKEDSRYTGLRTPWIMAGTPALLDCDQSRLGDRFLKVFIEAPNDDEKRDILRKVGWSALDSVRMTSNGDPAAQIERRLCEAYQLTGGYVDWLRSNTDLLSTIDMDETALDYCATLAEFTAYMRSAPNSNPKKDDHPTVEMPTRLNHQFVRLAMCLAVVLNRDQVDVDVIRRVRKVAMDTSRGAVLDVARAVQGAGGLTVAALANRIGRTEDKTRTLLRFLKIVGVTQPNALSVKTGHVRWELTPKLNVLYRESHRA